jgi:hypothetical protein
MTEPTNLTNHPNRSLGYDVFQDGANLRVCEECVLAKAPQLIIARNVANLNQRYHPPISLDPFQEAVGTLLNQHEELRSICEAQSARPGKPEGDAP